VVKDNGLMVLRKRRYRDLKKVGIGGFLAKTRAPKTALSAKKDEETEEKKRPTWRPKKNKILVQYPEYIQAWCYQEETLFLIRVGGRGGGGLIQIRLFTLLRIRIQNGLSRLRKIFFTSLHNLP
jgi:hypothetical protein